MEFLPYKSFVHIETAFRKADEKELVALVTNITNINFSRTLEAGEDSLNFFVIAEDV